MTWLEGSVSWRLMRLTEPPEGAIRHRKDYHRSPGSSDQTGRGSSDRARARWGPSHHCRRDAWRNRRVRCKISGSNANQCPTASPTARACTGAQDPDGNQAIDVKRPKVHDRAYVPSEEKIRFTSAIPPNWARRSKSLDTLPQLLYLRGMSTGDFQEVLAALLGQDAPNLSLSVIARLTASWEAEYTAWKKRDLSARR